MTYTVYTINLQNGKVLYVGKTNNFKKRKWEHLSLRAHTKEWIEAVGVDNISITPIAEFQSKEEALKYEDMMIVQFNTIEDGFNERRSGLIEVSDENEYKKRYYDEHKVDHAAYQRRYYATNEEYRKYLSEYHKQYYQAHKSDFLKREKMRRQAQKEQKQMEIDIANTPKGQFVQLTIPF